MTSAARKLPINEAFAIEGSKVETRQKARAIDVLLKEADALHAIAHRLQSDDGVQFCSAVEMILQMQGRLIVIGIGKAGWVGQKIAATFSSTGTPSHFVHPSEAVHGDLGRIHPDDIVLLLSNSGKSDEVVRLLPHLKSHTAGIVAITANLLSPVADASDIVLEIPSYPEACSNGLAPTTSTTSMMAIGDALAMVVSDERGFAASDFAKFHPGGSLGNQLKSVNELMRPLEECRVAFTECSIRDVLVGVARPGRRSGAVMLVDSSEKLQGIFTDSDLAKLLERRQDQSLDEPIANSMVRKFSAIRSGALASDAVMILAQKKISELPVVDEFDKPIGMIDITDLIGLIDPNEISTAVESESDKDFEFSTPATLRLFS